MIAARLMAPAGLAKVVAANASGMWNALDAAEALEVPNDLALALDVDPKAKAHWEEFPRSVKRGILEWIGNAKRPETCAQRIHQTATPATENQRAN